MAPSRLIVTARSFLLLSTAVHEIDSAADRVYCSQSTFTCSPIWQAVACVGTRNSPNGPGNAPDQEFFATPPPSELNPVPSAKSAGAPTSRHESAAITSALRHGKSDQPPSIQPTNQSVTAIKVALRSGPRLVRVGFSVGGGVAVAGN